LGDGGVRFTFFAFLEASFGFLCPAQGVGSGDAPRVRPHAPKVAMENGEYQAVAIHLGRQILEEAADSLDHLLLVLGQQWTPYEQFGGHPCLRSDPLLLVLDTAKCLWGRGLPEVVKVNDGFSQLNEGLRRQFPEQLLFVESDRHVLDILN
jgi:hypothetical protein